MQGANYSPAATRAARSVHASVIGLKMSFSLRSSAKKLPNVFKADRTQTVRVHHLPMAGSHASDRKGRCRAYVIIFNLRKGARETRASV